MTTINITSSNVSIYLGKKEDISNPFKVTSDNINSSNNVEISDTLDHLRTHETNVKEIASLIEKG